MRAHNDNLPSPMSMNKLRYVIGHIACYIEKLNKTSALADLWTVLYFAALHLYLFLTKTS